MPEMKEEITAPLYSPLCCSGNASKAEYVRMQNESEQKHDRKNDDRQSSTYSFYQSQV
jgi:hypothetical protein